jgi:hypothetical protein
MDLKTLAQRIECSILLDDPNRFTRGEPELDDDNVDFVSEPLCGRPDDINQTVN